MARSILAATKAIKGFRPLRLVIFGHKLASFCRYPTCTLPNQPLPPVVAFGEEVPPRSGRHAEVEVGWQSSTAEVIRM